MSNRRDLSAMHRRAQRAEGEAMRLRRELDTATSRQRAIAKAYGLDNPNINWTRLIDEIAAMRKVGVGIVVRCVTDRVRLGLRISDLGAHTKVTLRTAGVDHVLRSVTDHQIDVLKQLERVVYDHATPEERAAYEAERDAWKARTDV